MTPTCVPNPKPAPRVRVLFAPCLQTEGARSHVESDDVKSAPWRRSGLWTLACLMLAGVATAHAAVPTTAPASQPRDDVVRRQLQEQLDQLQKTGRAFELVSRLVRPTVVHVVVWRSASPGRPSDRQPPANIRRTTGSGLIVSAEGHVLTNNHVVQNAIRITVRLADKREFVVPKDKVWTDPETDVAVLQVQAKGLPVARLGNSDRIQVGHWVLAIGAPFGFRQSVTHGIISAKGRTNVNRSTTSGPVYQDFIQTDAAINPGNSGGPLVNLRGEVIGINTLIATRGGGAQGVGFAIPINLAGHVMRQLLEHGEVVRGFLGVKISDAVGEPAGALVEWISPGLPADKAGLRRGDIIIKFGGRPISDSDTLMRIVAETPIGEAVPVVVVRGRQEVALRVTAVKRTPERVVGELPAPERIVTAQLRDFGFRAAELTPELARALKVQRAGGIVVTEIEKDGPAWKEGLRRGDIILKVEDTKVATLKELEAALTRVKDPAEGVMFYVRRRAVFQFFLIHPRGKPDH